MMKLKEIDLEDRKQLLTQIMAIITVLIVVASISRALILPAGVDIDLNALIASLCIAIGTSLFATAFILAGMQESNNMIRMIDFMGGISLIASVTLGSTFGTLLITALSGIIITGMLGLSVAFVLISLGIYLLRRSKE